MDQLPRLHRCTHCRYQAADRHRQRNRGPSMWRQIWTVGLESLSDQFSSVLEHSLSTLWLLPGLLGDGRRQGWQRRTRVKGLSVESCRFLDGRLFQVVPPVEDTTVECLDFIQWIGVGLRNSLNYQCGLGLCNIQYIIRIGNDLLSRII